MTNKQDSFEIGQHVRVLNYHNGLYQGLLACESAFEFAGEEGVIVKLEYAYEGFSPEARVCMSTGGIYSIELCFLEVIHDAPRFKVSPRKLSPQCSILLSHFEKGRSITQRSALIDFGIAALPRRIADLKAAGYEIVSVMESNKLTGQRYARYSMPA